VVSAVFAWTALAVPASAEFVVVAHHSGADPAPAAPAPHADFVGGLRQRFGLPSGSAPATPDQPAAPPVARYVVNTISFTLDMSGPEPLLRYSNSTEVWALRAVAGTRGDTRYVNDAGEEMLRATGLGGLTAFTVDEPQGMAAAFAGAAQPIVALPDIRSGLQVYARMGKSGLRLTHMIGHQIIFAAGDPSDPELEAENLPLVADTVDVAMDAFERALLPKFSKKKSAIPGLGEVHITKGVPPDAYVKDGKLFLIITPARGVAGRPSSQKIFKVLMH
jgi:hypothetical protein